MPHTVPLWLHNRAGMQLCVYRTPLTWLIYNLLYTAGLSRCICVVRVCSSVWIPTTIHTVHGHISSSRVLNSNVFCPTVVPLTDLTKLYLRINLKFAVFHVRFVLCFIPAVCTATLCPPPSTWKCHYTPAITLIPHYYKNITWRSFNSVEDNIEFGNDPEKA